jgi:hypothetical protein
MLKLGAWAILLVKVMLGISDNPVKTGMHFCPDRWVQIKQFKMFSGITRSCGDLLVLRSKQ